MTQTEPRMRGTWGDPVAEATARCTARRARVLAHPDIAVRLTQRPLRYSAPEAWTGYIPSNEVPTMTGWKPNPSPIRHALLDICRAVETRENQLPEEEDR